MSFLTILNSGNDFLLPAFLQAKIHKHYVEYILNPFTRIDDTPIKSTSFHSRIEQDVDAFNRGLA